MTILNWELGSTNHTIVLAASTETKWRWLEQDRLLSLLCKVWVGRWSRKIQHLCLIKPSRALGSFCCVSLWSSWEWSKPTASHHVFHTHYIHTKQRKERKSKHLSCSWKMFHTWIEKFYSFIGQNWVTWQHKPQGSLEM